MDSSSLVLVLGQSAAPDESYAMSFRHFQALFRSCGPADDVSKIQLPSYLHDTAYQDFVTLGSVITGALLAMLAHSGDDADWSAVPLQGLRVYVKSKLPGPVRELFDEIILTQGAITGMGLLASDIVMMRVLEWERGDYAKSKRWLGALDKFARVIQWKMKTPFGDPFLAEYKRQAVKQILPALTRLQDWHRSQRTLPADQQIVEAFAEEAKNPDLPFLHHPHNWKRWLDFCREEPRTFLTASPETLFDSFFGFVSKHDPDYARKMISSSSSN
jgi:hypothetical protein